jgi:hypothetical protein
MSKNLSWRLYFERPIYEAARIIGYARCSPSDFWDKAKQLGIPQGRLHKAVYDLTRADKQEASPPRYELAAEARQTCYQRLGPAPEHPLADCLRHGPPDVIGEGIVRRWQEEYRKQKEAGQAEGPEKKPTSRPRRRSAKGKQRPSTRLRSRLLTSLKDPRRPVRGQR